MAQLTLLTPAPTFIMEAAKLGLDDANLEELHAQIFANPDAGAQLTDLPGVRSIRFRPSSGQLSDELLRVYIGNVSESHLILIAVRRKAEQLPPEERAKAYRYFKSLRAMYGGPVIKRSVLPPSEYDSDAIRQLREQLAVSQSVFANLLGVSSMLVQAWEQGTRGITPLARRLLDQIAADPEKFLARCFVAPKED